MLSKEVRDLINVQINKELFSAYLYLGIADYYEELGLEGFANWYEIQAQEERDHAMLMRTYLHNNGENVILTAIDAPGHSYTDAGQPLKTALEHEEYVTSLINKIYKAASKDDDYRTMQFFDWFVKEQGEEEKNSQDLIRKFELYGQDPKGLYALNQELMGRVYAAPSLTV